MQLTPSFTLNGGHRSNTYVQQVDIRHSRSALTATAVEEVLRTLNASPSIVSVDLGGNGTEQQQKGLREACVVNLCHRLQANDPALQSLDWSNRNGNGGISDEELSAVTSTLPGNKHLRSINLDGNVDVTDKGITPLLAVLHSCAVARVGLLCTSVSRGVKTRCATLCIDKLLQPVRDNSKACTVLDLSMILGMVDIHLLGVGEALVGNHVLRTLKLSGNDGVTDGAVCALLPALEFSSVETFRTPPAASAGTRKQIQKLCAANRARNAGGKSALLQVEDSLVAQPPTEAENLLNQLQAQAVAGFDPKIERMVARQLDSEAARLAAIRVATNDRLLHTATDRMRANLNSNLRLGPTMEPQVARGSGAAPKNGPWAGAGADRHRVALRISTGASLGVVERASIQNRQSRQNTARRRLEWD